jgi:hypothetical protein
MMTAPAIGLAISFVVILSVIFSGALVGMLIGWLLPDHHLSSELKGWSPLRWRWSEPYLRWCSGC